MKGKWIVSLPLLISLYTSAHNMKPVSKEVTTKELADRIAIGELINNYARYADRREPQQQANLFTEDATIEIYHSEPGNNKPDTILHGRKEFVAGFETLKQYE